MKFEGIFGIPMGGMLVEVAGNIDDGDGFEWTFLKGKLISTIQQ
jgi:hypothetical protein